MGNIVENKIVIRSGKFEEVVEAVRMLECKKEKMVLVSKVDVDKEVEVEVEAEVEAEAEAEVEVEVIDIAK